MIHYFHLLIASILVAYPLAFAKAEQGPWESWLTTSISQRLDYGLELGLESELRLSAQDPLWSRLELIPQLTWHYSPRYDFGLGYENNLSELASGEIRVGHEGFAFGTVKIPFAFWKLESRQRFQFGAMEGEESGVFRHQVRLSYERFRLRPFMGNEAFVDLLNGELSENRARVGVRYSVNPHAQVELYGMRIDRWEVTGAHEWAPVVGAGIMWEF
ncbi:MAG: DUF2490 domain-containing protein [Blastochloris sp.]|nr:DUF2490 domain-containing protein [Blastochloris sp.]